MTATIRKCVAPSAIALLASIAWAQAPEQPTEQRKQGEEAAKGEVKRLGESQQDEGIEVFVLRLIKFSALENTTVKTVEGKDIGHIDEVMVDPQTGQVRYAALSFGGLGELGDKKFAIPLEALDIQSEDLVVFDVTKEDLEKSEGFNEKEWPSHASSRWAEKGQPSQMKAKAHQGSQQTTMRLQKSSALVGMAVKNRQDEQLGSISELYIDPDRSRVVYATMSHGGVLGIGDKLFAVPWQSFETQKDALILDIPKSRLEDAPYAAAAEHDTWYDPDWVINVYHFYGVQPYWKANERQGDQGQRSMDKVQDKRK